ncbi:MAG: hypothetical protein LIP23_06335 [Planctomycetes bacterium]|nr:hypothetical protein [Planctomycetota bacterium]
MGMAMAARASAFLDGRTTVGFDDVKKVAPPILRTASFSNTAPRWKGRTGTAWCGKSSMPPANWSAALPIRWPPAWPEDEADAAGPSYSSPAECRPRRPGRGRAGCVHACGGVRRRRKRRPGDGDNQPAPGVAHPVRRAAPYRYRRQGGDGDDDNRDAAGRRRRRGGEERLAPGPGPDQDGNLRRTVERRHRGVRGSWLARKHDCLFAFAASRRRGIFGAPLRRRPPASRNNRPGRGAAFEPYRLRHNGSLQSASPVAVLSGLPIHYPPFHRRRVPARPRAASGIAPLGALARRRGVAGRSRRGTDGARFGVGAGRPDRQA